MRNNIIKVYPLAVLILLSVLVLFVGLRIKKITNDNYTSNHESFTKLVTGVRGKKAALGEKIYTNTFAFTNEDNAEQEITSYLTAEISRLTSAQNRLVFLKISTQSDLLLFTKSQDIFSVPPTNQNIVADGFKLKASKLIQWTTQIETATISDSLDNSTTYTGLYILLEPAELLPYFVIVFASLLVLLILNVLILLYQPAKMASSAPTVTAPQKDTSGLFSEKTGLSWESHILPKLKFELDKAASFDQDLVFALTTIDNLAELKNSPRVYHKIASELLASFAYRDLLFEYKNNGFALIIPDADLNQGIAALKSFRQKIAVFRVESKPLKVSIGIGSRGGRLISEAALLKETHIALNKAKSNPRTDLVAFRVNTEKYRNYIAQHA